MTDKTDEIVDVQASVMTGVAREVTLQKMMILNKKSDSHHPILNDKFSARLINKLTELIDLEYSLYFLINKYVGDDIQDHTLSTLMM